MPIHNFPPVDWAQMFQALDAYKNGESAPDGCRYVIEGELMPDGTLKEAEPAAPFVPGEPT